jgi:hypothetical protein
MVRKARTKKNKRNSVLKAAEQRRTAQEQAVADYQARLASRMTRHRAKRVEQELGPPPQAPAAVARSVSVVSHKSFTAITALDSLLARSDGPMTPSPAKKKEKRDAVSDQQRPPLADITNHNMQTIPSFAVDADPPVPPLSSSISSAEVSQSQLSTPPPAPQPSSIPNPPQSAPAIMSSSSSFTDASGSAAGLMTTKQRLEANKSKKDMKKAIAGQVEGMVQQELQKQQAAKVFAEKGTLALEHIILAAQEVRLVAALMREKLEWDREQRGKPEARRREEAADDSVEHGIDPTRDRHGGKGHL